MVGIDEDRRRTDRDHGVGVGREGEARDEHLVAVADVERAQRQFQRGGTAGDADGVRSAGDLRHLALEVEQRATLRKALPVERVHDGVEVGPHEVGLGKGMLLMVWS